jgi:hypothetical protein
MVNFFARSFIKYFEFIQIYGKAEAASDQLKARNETCLREITHLLVSEGSNCVAKFTGAHAG